MILLALLTAATLAAEPVPVKLASSPVKCSEDISPGLCEAYERRFISQLTRTKELSVTTPSDVAQVLGLERQKQLLGCTDDASSCAAELAGALGVDGILSGAVTRTSSGYLLTLKVLRASDGVEWAGASERLATEGQLLDALDPIAARFINELTGKRTVNVFRVVMWSGVGLGVGLVAGGGALVGLSKSQAALLKSDQPQSPLELQQTAATGSTYQTAGGLMLGVGVPVILTCLVLALVDPSSKAKVAILPSVSPAGAQVLLRWELP